MHCSFFCFKSVQCWHFLLLIFSLVHAHRECLEFSHCAYRFSMWWSSLVVDDVLSVVFSEIHVVKSFKWSSAATRSHFSWIVHDSFIEFRYCDCINWSFRSLFVNAVDLNLFSSAPSFLIQFQIHVQIALEMGFVSFFFNYCTWRSEHK